MTHGYLPPALLTNHHVVESFACRSEEQTHWLRQYARQSAAAGTTKVLVVTQRDRVEVVGYYAWCMASIALEAAPQRLRKRAGRYPQPVALLARLGVSIHQDVIKRAAALGTVGTVIGCRGLLVHAETSAVSHYLPAPDPRVRALADSRAPSAAAHEGHSPHPERAVGVMSASVS